MPPRSLTMHLRHANRVLHVHGQIGYLDWQVDKPAFAIPYGQSPTVELLDRVIDLISNPYEPTLDDDHALAIVADLPIVTRPNHCWRLA